MRGNTSKNKLFRYSGNKEWFSGYVNSVIAEIGIDFKSYYELFLGSGSVFLNLNVRFGQCFINDKSPWIYLMWSALKTSTYADYRRVLDGIRLEFGDIRANKRSYYAFRNAWNSEFASKYVKSGFKDHDSVAGLQLLVLASSCLNSMLRFGPAGMNQSFGNRFYEIPEFSWNEMKARVMDNVVLSNLDFTKFDFKPIRNSVLFLDPPYVGREMTYNKVGFDLGVFIEKIKDLDDSNMVLYTDFENDVSDGLVGCGFSKLEIRQMQSTSPNRKTGVEKTGKEILYLKKPVSVPRMG